VAAAARYRTTTTYRVELRGLATEYAHMSRALLFGIEGAAYERPYASKEGAYALNKLRG
jgi:hypothetical protein